MRSVKVNLRHGAGTGMGKEELRWPRGKLVTPLWKTVFEIKVKYVTYTPAILLLSSEESQKTH